MEYYKKRQLTIQKKRKKETRQELRAILYRTIRNRSRKRGEIERAISRIKGKKKPNRAMIETEIR